MFMENKFCLIKTAIDSEGKSCNTCKDAVK